MSIEIDQEFIDQEMRRYKDTYASRIDEAIGPVFQEMQLNQDYMSVAAFIRHLMQVVELMQAYVLSNSKVYSDFNPDEYLKH